MQRQSELELQQKRLKQSVDNYITITDELKIQFDTDYNEFVRDRKRWKTDFDIASKKARDTFIDI